MKKFGVFSAILALALLSCLAFVSCWTTGSASEPTKFEGRWLDPIPVNDYGFTDYSYTFTGNTFVLRLQSSTMDDTYSGTFKYTNNKIRFTSGKKTWTQTYTLIGNELNLILNRDISAGIAPVAGKFMKP